MQLPQQLLILHGQTLVDLGLFLQRLLENGLFTGQLPAGGDRELEWAEGRHTVAIMVLKIKGPMA